MEKRDIITAITAATDCSRQEAESVVDAYHEVVRIAAEQQTGQSKFLRMIGDKAGLETFDVARIVEFYHKLMLAEGK